MEALNAGELGRDLGGLKGDELRRIDCKTRVAIALDGREERGREVGTTGRRWMAQTRDLSIKILGFGTFVRITPSDPKQGKRGKIMFEIRLGVLLCRGESPSGPNGNNRTNP